MQIKKFNRTYYIYILIATTIIFSVSERECMVYQYESSRMYKIVLSTMGCGIALLFNSYTISKAKNTEWEHKKQFQIISYMINIYIISLFVYMYIPIITKTDQYRIGLFRTIQDNLFIIFCVQWIKINIVGKYLEKVKEVGQTLSTQRTLMVVFFICLLHVAMFMFVFGWRYEKKTHFRFYYSFFQSAERNIETYFEDTLPKNSRKKRYFLYETHFDKKIMLTFFTKISNVDSYVADIIKTNNLSVKSQTYYYHNTDTINEKNCVVNKKIMEEVVKYIPYNLKNVRNISDLELVFFTVQFYDPGLVVRGIFVDRETGQIVQFVDWNKREIKKEEWLELLTKYYEPENG